MQQHIDSRLSGTVLRTWQGCGSPKNESVLAREKNSFSRTAPNKINAISHKTAILNVWHGLISMVVKVITVNMIISDTVTEWLR